MNNLKLSTKMFRATKWATFAELASKFIVPITNMILARILAPDAFGVLATVVMIISFAEMFADAGFQKYLIQHEFKDDIEKDHYTNVAFWTNLIITVILWGAIACFSTPITKLVGSPGLEMVIIIACLQLPLTAITSVQMSLYKRDFDFKSLFLVRIVFIFIPFIVTIPLALLNFGHWSLIIGNLAGQIANALILTAKSKWKPKLFYNFRILKKMLSFSIWSLIEAISIWFTSWVDILLIGNTLNNYYSGLYRTSVSMVNSLMAIITAATVPVLFSALSRLQNDQQMFNETFLKTQKAASILVYPLAIGVFLYSDLATLILLGNKWHEASGVIGHWALTSGIVIVNGYYCSEVYRAKGLPKLSFLAQVLHLIVLIPVCIFSSKYGFWALVFARSWIRLQSILVDFMFLKVFIGIPISKVAMNTFPSAVSACTMGVIGYLLKLLSDEIGWKIASIFICVPVYFGILCLFPNMRKQVIYMARQILREFRVARHKTNVEAQFKSFGD